MTLENAFTKVINTRGLLTSLGYSRYTVHNLKRNFDANKVSVEKMREIVSAAGGKCVQPEKWKL